MNLLKLKIAKVKGIPIILDAGTLTMLVLIAIMDYKLLPLFLIIYGVVICHELGHSVTALYYKYKVEKITIYPFGGIAAISMEKASNKEVFFIIMNGLITHVLFALAGYLLGYSWFVKFNIFMFVFNLIPAYPMDGGRLFKCILIWFKIKEKIIINILFFITKIIACAFLFYAFKFSLVMLGFIAFLLLIIPKKSFAQI